MVMVEWRRRIGMVFRRRRSWWLGLALVVAGLAAVAEQSAGGGLT
jgi:hypothetical protein